MHNRSAMGKRHRRTCSIQPSQNPRADCLGRRGLAIAVTSSLARAHYFGDRFHGTAAVLVPFEERHLPAVSAFVMSSEFVTSVREVDQALSVTESSFTKVAFDLVKWQRVAEERYPTGLPEPFYNEPGQLFYGGATTD